MTFDPNKADAEARRKSAEKVYHWCVIQGYDEDICLRARQRVLNGGADSSDDVINDIFSAFGRKK